MLPLIHCGDCGSDGIHTTGVLNLPIYMMRTTAVFFIYITCNRNTLYRNESFFTLPLDLSSFASIVYHIVWPLTIGKLLKVHNKLLCKTQNIGEYHNILFTNHSVPWYNRYMVVVRNRVGNRRPCFFLIYPRKVTNSSVDLRFLVRCTSPSAA